ncbi:MAG TPA: SDR family NAD(P)-dependent oxidoreductase [Candidatus Binatia bacterium]|jgi:NAD(P)-dependent dehydrogenase (short-subunit alcohol dehydrogenase family)|nr:SDR family NAD(P)-dependent oxidoreductase [Candidatus Binatia bacterium]
MAIALITGAASLMGEGIAQALAARDWELMLSDINEDGARSVAAKLPANIPLDVARMDVTDRAGVRAVVQKMAARFGAIDALVNCAGGLRGLGLKPKPLAELPPEEWRRVIDVNLKGTLNVIHAVLPVMKRQRRGAIVSIAASRGLRGGKNAAHYSAAKAGIIVFTQTMVLECAEYGVRINSIAPGNADARWKSADDGSTPAPLGRATSAEDIGKAVAWLVSDEAAHVTGACIDVSGGTALY